MLVGIDDSTGQTLGVIDGSPTPSALGDLAVLLLTPDVTANGTYNNANTSTPYLDTLSNSLNCLLWDLIVKEAENFPDALYGFSTSNSNSLTTYFWQQLGQSPVGPPPGPNTTPGWNDPILFYFPN
jgi:hypothetical protein